MFNIFKQNKQISNTPKRNARNKVVKPTSSYQFGDLDIPIFRNPRRKSIAVKHKNNQIFIEAPKAASKKQIEQVLEKNQAWLLSQIDKHKLIKLKSFTGKPGDSFDFFGKKYHCIWSELDPQQSRKLSEYELCETSKTMQMRFKSALTEERRLKHAQKALLEIFKHKAQTILQSKTQYYAEKMGLQYQSITIKGYKSRWGSCYPDGRIQFNWRLLQAPEWVVDYVVVHELAHLVHANHSSDFWNLVVDYYPKTQAAKKCLKAHGHHWINLLQS